MVKLYHYIFTENLLSPILKDATLKPANITRQNIEKYQNRITSGDADEYFKSTYNYFYQQATKESYKNYGIYLTTLNLFEFGNRATARFTIPFDRLQGKTVIQIGLKVSLVQTIQDIISIANHYTNIKKVQHLYNTSKFPFSDLPQVVNFSDAIPISKKDLEHR